MRCDAMRFHSLSKSAHKENAMLSKFTSQIQKRRECRAVLRCACPKNAIAMLIQKRASEQKGERKKARETPAARALSRSAHLERAMSMATNVGRALLNGTAGTFCSSGYGLPNNAPVAAETELRGSVAHYGAIGGALAWGVGAATAAAAAGG
jgi:DNA-binding transcriptional regulator YbjK